MPCWCDGLISTMPAKLNGAALLLVAACLISPALAVSQVPACATVCIDVGLYHSTQALRTHHTSAASIRSFADDVTFTSS